MGQSWEQEISPGLRQAEQEGRVTGRIRRQRPACGTVLQWLWGQHVPRCPHWGPVPKEQPHPGLRTGPAPRGAGTCAGLGSIQLSQRGWCLCQDRPSSLGGWHVWLQDRPVPACSLGHPTIPGPVKERFMTSVTLQNDESDGEGFLLHSQALKNPGFPKPGSSPAMALSQHDNDHQAAARGSSWC